MKAKYTVEIVSHSIIEELPGGWSDADYRALLDEMDIDGISEMAPGELKDMCLMALTDNNPEDAAKVILKYVFKDRLKSGQIDNISNEMLDEKMWEEYPELSFHEDFFRSATILYSAFDGGFPHPKAISFQACVSTKQAEHLELLDAEKENGLIRLLTQGMPESTLIHRLFDEKLEEGPFEEAGDIIWQLTKKREDLALKFDVISSLYWFKDIAEMDQATFEAQLTFEDP